jgi:antirestriction protein
MNAQTHIEVTDIKIYVADLAAYNAGHLHGVWIDATEDTYDQQEKINEMLKTSPVGDAEEYAIHDHDGFEGCLVYEYEGLQSAHEKALFIQAHGHLGAVMLAHMADDFEAAKTALEDNYYGEYESLSDYARELTEDSGDVPEHLANYIDYAAMGRDMDISGDIYTIETAHDEVHIFANC